MTIDPGEGDPWDDAGNDPYLALLVLMDATAEARLDEAIAAAELPEGPT